MADTGWVIVGTGANVNLPGSTPAWTNPGNITADDATAASVTLVALESSDLLLGTNLGLSIPSDQIITLIETRVDVLTYTTTNDLSADVALIIGGSAAGVGAPAFEPTVGNHEVSQTPSAWGTPVTPAQANANDFGFRLRVRELNSDAGPHTSGIDHMAMRLTFEPAPDPPPPSRHTFNRVFRFIGEPKYRSLLARRLMGRDDFRR